MPGTLGDALAHVYTNKITVAHIRARVDERVLCIPLFANALARSYTLFAEVRKRPRAVVSHNGFIFVMACT